MKKNIKNSASNERQLSGDTGTILEYTIVPGPNQSGLSWDRGSRPGTLHSSRRWEVQFQGIVIEIVHTNTIVRHTN